jgi:cytochrome c
MSHRNSTRKRWVVMVGLHLAFLSCTSAPTTAQANQPSAERGKELAVRLCKNCHLIDNAAGSSVPAGSPTFRSMATAPGQTSERILSVLIRPHAPMPDIQLSRAEIDNIIAYLDMFRAEQSLPALLPPTGGAQPTLPSKS